jgi:DNA phosphorothioation-dependent restriction protein DptH
LAFSATCGDYLVQEWAELDPAGLAAPGAARAARALPRVTPDLMSVDAAMMADLKRRLFFGQWPATEAKQEVRSYRHLDAYGKTLATILNLGENGIAITATLGPEEQAALCAAHQRADWVLMLDRHLGVDLFAAPPEVNGAGQSYILDYAPDFLEGLGPRLTVTTAHPSEVRRLLTDAMTELDLATVEESVRVVLRHLQVVSGRLAMRLVGRSTLATEAVSLAALMAYLRARGALQDTIIVPVDAHQDVFGDSIGEAAARRCDVMLVRATSRTLRIECVEAKSGRAALLPMVLADEIVDQLESTVTMLRETFFRTDPPRIDAELQRTRLVGILRYHANRAQAMGLLDTARRADAERLLERIEEGTLVPEISTTGYVISLRGQSDGLPREHRGVRIHFLTAAELNTVGLASVRTDLDDEGNAAGTVDVPPDPRPHSEPASHLGSTGKAEPSADLTFSPKSSAQETQRALGPPEAIDVHLGQDAHAAAVRWRISTRGSPTCS